MVGISQVGAIAHQASRLCVFTPWIYCWYFVASCQRYNLIAMGGKGCVRAYGNCAGSLLDERRKGGLQIRFHSCADRENPQTVSTRCSLIVSHVGVGWIVWVCEQRDQTGLGH